MYANVNANDSAKPKRYKPETGGILPISANLRVVVLRLI